MKHAATAILVLGLAGCIDPMPRQHSMDDPYTEMDTHVLLVQEKRTSPSPAKLAASCTVSLAAAIETALGKVKGQALNAEIEIENGKAVIEVKVFSDGKLWEVEIDGTTGAVIEVEQEDDDDDDDGMDDDDGDDD